jgi:hypothetical protein
MSIGGERSSLKAKITREKAKMGKLESGEVQEGALGAPPPLSHSPFRPFVHSFYFSASIIGCAVFASK